MPKFMIAYRGGREYETPEESQKGRERWMKWIDDLGDAVVNPGTPLLNSKTVTPSGVSDGDENRLTGFTTVNAESLKDVLEMAKKCPFLEVGTLEVAEMSEM